MADTAPLGDLRSDLGAGPFFVWPQSLASHPAQTMLLATDGAIDAVVAVDPITGDRTVLSDATTGTGPAFDHPGSVAFDVANGRVLVVDAELEALFAVELATGNRAVIASSSVGSGPGLRAPESVEVGSFSGSTHQHVRDRPSATRRPLIVAFCRMHHGPLRRQPLDADARDTRGTIRAVHGDPAGPGVLFAGSGGWARRLVPASASEAPASECRGAEHDG